MERNAENVKNVKNVKTDADAPLGQGRLQALQNELGAGEGVTQLLRHANEIRSAGGEGVVAVGPPDDNAMCTDALNCFAASVGFADSLCSCSAAITPLPAAQRPAVLERSLNIVNAELNVPGGGMHNVRTAILPPRSLRLALQWN